MNYLAHLYLSGSSDEIRLGNFMGDFVKGRDYNKYPDEIRRGILLHRSIDFFTDNHDVVRYSMQRLRKRYHKYAGVIVDIMYDHYLSVEWKSYSKQPLSGFIRSSYANLIRNYSILPDRLKTILPILIAQNRLGAYSRMRGIKDSLKMMSRFTSLPPEYKFGMRVMRNHYEDFRNEFNSFFPDIIEYVSQVYNIEIDYYALRNDAISSFIDNEDSEIGFQA